MLSRVILAGAAVTTGLALVAVPTAAMAATPTQLSSVVSAADHQVGVRAISAPTATVVNHPPYGKVYQLRGSISGAQTGDWVRVLDSRNQPVPGFKAFQLSNPISTYTVYFNPGSLGGVYKVKIGNQVSPGVQLNPIPGSAPMATAAVGGL
jgi:hypothetical protein